MIYTPICEMLGIQYPIFQGGMAHISDARLAAAVSNGGGLGIITAANGDVQMLKEQIDLARTLTDKPFGVNVMLMGRNTDSIAQVIAEKKVAVVTTGAGNPEKYVPMWKEAGIKVVPVVPSTALAKLVVRSGADAVIAEGGESGGHVGELTTMALVPQMIATGAAGANEIAVFTAMGMCWSGYLSTHISMMDALGKRQFIKDAIISHTIGGLAAGVAAHYIWVVVSLL